MSALVIYHANCYDGFTAAWIARQAMPDCELFEGRYGEEPPYLKAQERDTYILDFSYPRDQMVKLAAYGGATGSLTVLDHHKTAEANCKGLEFCRFDMSRSGAGMTWDWFYEDEPRPDWVNRIEDRDLWRFFYDDTINVHAFVASLSMTMENWDTINALTIEVVANSGRIIRRYIETYIEKAAEHAETGTHLGTPVVALNVPYMNASETADYLLKAHPSAAYSMTYFRRNDGRWQYSLRSRSDFDVSEVAQNYGGGGHAQAAGFDIGNRLRVEVQP